MKLSFELVKIMFSFINHKDSSCSIVHPYIALGDYVVIFRRDFPCVFAYNVLNSFQQVHHWTFHFCLSGNFPSKVDICCRLIECAVGYMHLYPTRKRNLNLQSSPSTVVKLWKTYSKTVQIISSYFIFRWFSFNC